MHTRRVAVYTNPEIEVLRNSIVSLMPGAPEIALGDNATVRSN